MKPWQRFNEIVEQMQFIQKIGHKTDYYHQIMGLARAASRFYEDDIKHASSKGIKILEAVDSADFFRNEDDAITVGVALATIACLRRDRTPKFKEPWRVALEMQDKQ